MASNNTPAPPVELSDSFMEQMVGLVRDINKMKEGIWALVAEMRRLVRVVERWMEREEKVMEYEEKSNEEKGEEKKDEWMEMEDELVKDKEEEEKKKDKEEKMGRDGEMEKGKEKGGDEEKVVE